METATHSPDLSGLRNKAIFVGLIGVVACLAGFAANHEQFLQSYVLAYIYWLLIPVSCCGLLCLHHLVGGGWGIVIRRLLEAGTRTLPLTAVLVIPILVNLPAVYEWARPDVVAGDKLLQHRATYLNPTFFTIRLIVYFGIWLTLAFFLNKWSAEQENGGGEVAKDKLRNLSGPGVVLHILTVTFAAFDLGMSLEPHWASTIYGVLYLFGGCLSTMAFIILILKKVHTAQPLDTLVKPNHFHDLGTLMFAFVVLWAYVSFSQFLIIWSGNLPEETPWYIKRMNGAWGNVALVLMVFHFALPFFLLLMRVNKKKAAILGTIASFMLVMRWVDITWLIAPAFQHGDGEHGAHFIHWLDIATPIAIGGLWIGFYAYQLGRKPLMPVEAVKLAAGGHH